MILPFLISGLAAECAGAGASVVGGDLSGADTVMIAVTALGHLAGRSPVTRSGARPGDALVFTKRIGKGVISTALKRGIASPAHVETAIASMLTLNRVACERMLELDVHGCTDVTGFGFIGHAREMALGSGVTLEIEVDRLQFLPGAIEYARAGAIPGGLNNNKDFASCVVESARELPEEIENLLYDPQTSGGLLIALPESDADALTASLETAYRVGRVLTRAAKPIRLI